MQWCSSIKITHTHIVTKKHMPKSNNCNQVIECCLYCTRINLFHWFIYNGSMSNIQFYRHRYFYLLRLSKSPAAAAYIKLTIVSPLLSYRTLLGFSLLTNLVELSYLNSKKFKWNIHLELQNKAFYLTFKSNLSYLWKLKTLTNSSQKAKPRTEFPYWSIFGE